MKNQLKQIIRQLVIEAMNDSELIDEDEPTTDDERVEEFCSAGAIAGYSLPLGMNPDAAGRKKNASKKNRK